MPAIGAMRQTTTGWIGSIFLLGRDVKIKLTPNDNQIHPNAPAFHIFAGSAELGALWRETSKESNSSDFLSGTVDFPGLGQPISVAVFFSPNRTKARIVWKRRPVHSVDELGEM